jgi:hypothetical protein
MKPRYRLDYYVNPKTQQDVFQVLDQSNTIVGIGGSPDEAVTKFRKNKITQAIHRHKRPEWSEHDSIYFAACFASDCFLIIEEIMNAPVVGYDVEISEITKNLGFTRKEVLAILKDDEESGQAGKGV